MDSSMKILYQLAEQKGMKNKSAVAAALGETSQTINNWESRGMSKAGMMKAGDVFNCDPRIFKGEINIAAVAQQVPEYGGQYKKIKKYNDIGGSMGVGVILQDQAGEITEISVTDEWLNKNIPNNTGRENLCIVTGFGDSMKGMFNNGDPLIVDTGVKELNFDAIYFFRVGNEGFIKRLQRVPNVGIRAISKNPDYESWTITEDMDFQIFGRVIKVWESSDF